MSASHKLTRHLEFAGDAKPEVFVLDHPVDRIEPVDDEPETGGESATEAFAAWIKCCTHKGETLRPKDEIAVRIVGLVYLLDRGEKPIVQLAFEAGVPRSTLHRCIRLISEKTGLRIARKKTRSASTERALKNSDHHVRDGVTDA